MVKRENGFSFILNNINTSASLTKKSYFRNYYKDCGCEIYVPSPADQEFAQKAYGGGMNCVFYRGELKYVRSFDINSSYPASMTGSFPVGPYYRKNLNTKMSGQPLEQGIYRFVVIDTPRMLRFPLFGLKKDGLYTFSHLQAQEMYATAEEV